MRLYTGYTQSLPRPTPPYLMNYAYTAIWFMAVEEGTQLNTALNPW